MIPSLISSSHISTAIRRIQEDGIPSRRRSRGYCLVTDAGHLPPKYTIALAHQAATGEFLGSDRFNGGRESNEFLDSLGFHVHPCECGGAVCDSGVASEGRTPQRSKRKIVSKRHSERCPECKRRVREMLERIYGTCLPGHRFGWPTDLEAYDGTSISHVLRRVVAALKSHRGFGVDDFVRSKALYACDYWVPDQGFVVEFDESQHFTASRKLALEVYADEHPLGFSARRWMNLCDHHDAKDNDPPFRDEQRAWYDALRDLVPKTRGLNPTVRLYARDLAWCSLDPADRNDRARFSSLIGHETAPSRPRASKTRADAASKSTLSVAMVFPRTDRKSSKGVPPGVARDQRLLIPGANDFADETIDLVLFPEEYIDASDKRSAESLKILAFELGATLLVGATDNHVDTSGRAWQVLLRFDPDGAGATRVYVKHATAKAVAFERADWEPRAMLPTFELNGTTVGATLCQDSYLGLLPRYMARAGARVWVNPSFDNVKAVKWSSVHRLRAVENRFFALCTLHCDPNRRTTTHPFGFSPDGCELSARQAGSRIPRPLSECTEAGNIYVVELDMNAAGKPLDWSKLPPANKRRRRRNGQVRRPVRAAFRDGQPAILSRSGWKRIDSGRRIETENGAVYAEPVPEERMLDAVACFGVIDRAKQRNAAPVIWNHWQRLPAGADRLAMLMMGRAIECCAPILISDTGGIRELVELANRNKNPVRRHVEPSAEAIIDAGYAWGLNSAFKVVAKQLPASMRQMALDRYRSLV